jgi:hypothetical protein
MPTEAILSNPPSRPDTSTPPPAEPSWYHRHVCAATPFTGRDEDWRGLNAEYVDEPDTFIMREFDRAAADGFEALLLHRLSGRPLYRKDWKTSHEFNPFAETDPAFLRRLVHGIEKGFGRTGVQPVLYVGWLWNGLGAGGFADWAQDTFVDYAKRFFRQIRTWGLHVVIHDTAGGGALDDDELATLHAAAANEGVVYIPEGASDAARRSGLSTFNRNAKVLETPRKSLAWNQNEAPPTGKHFVCGIGANGGDVESEAEIARIADLGYPVWAWNRNARPAVLSAMQSRYSHRLTHPDWSTARDAATQRVLSESAKAPRERVLVTLQTEITHEANEAVGTESHFAQTMAKLGSEFAVLGELMKEQGLWRDAPTTASEGNGTAAETPADADKARDG